MRKRTVPQGGLVHCSIFAIDSIKKSSYCQAAPQGVMDQKFFENLAISKWQLAASQNKPKTGRKRGFDKAVMRLSNGTFVFVFNKSDYPRWGQESPTSP